MSQSWLPPAARSKPLLRQLQNSSRKRVVHIFLVSQRTRKGTFLHLFCFSRSLTFSPRFLLTIWDYLALDHLLSLRYLPIDCTWITGTGATYSIFRVVKNSTGVVDWLTGVVHWDCNAPRLGALQRRCCCHWWTIGARHLIRCILLLQLAYAVNHFSLLQTTHCCIRPLMGLSIQFVRWRGSSIALQVQGSWWIVQ